MADLSQPASSPFTQLHPLWIWLAIAASVSFFGTPADPVSMLLALAYGLGWFCIGAILGSPMPVVLRVFPLVVWAAPAAWLAMTFGHVYFLCGAVVYGAASSGMGAWAYRTIQNGRLRILASFCVGYVLGSMIGIMGTVAGAVMGAMIAKRTLSVSGHRGD